MLSRPAMILASAIAFLSLIAGVQGRPASDVEARDPGSTLPTVDLEYVVQRATVFNETGQYYNFSNIRYARAPVGELRFRAPLPPLQDRSEIQTGEVGRICPQANPAWLLTATQFIPQYLSGKTQFTPADFNTSAAASTFPAEDPRTTEDCLFLDVHVPKDIFDGKDKGQGAAVLVWLYGGGFVSGSKTSAGNPAGLLARGDNHDNKGVIIVAMNYRLGAFGWLSGPSLQEDGTANAALHDQRLALEWVQKNIRKFGGDPGRVTLVGESAGGGSIMHQITAYGGEKPVPFQQAVPQSPGWQLIASAGVQEGILSAYLFLLNVSTIAEARKLPYEELQAANVIQTGLSSYGSFTFGPAVDGDFVPRLPGQLLAEGRFAKNLTVMVGHNANEGLFVTSPYIQNDTSFTEFITSLMPTVAAFPLTSTYITGTLYPSAAYPNQIARTAAAVSELGFVCNTFYLDKAFGNKTYTYLFSVPPALHGADVPYTFYNEDDPSIIAPDIAIAMQEYITHFAEFGTPNEVGVPFFPIYGGNASVQVLNVTGIGQAVDLAANERCNWWQKGLAF